MASPYATPGIIQAIRNQNIKITKQILKKTPDLANSWVSNPPQPDVPLLYYATTIYAEEYNKRVEDKQYLSRLPADSIAIAELLLEHGAHLTTLLPSSPNDTQYWIRSALSNMAWIHGCLDMFKLMIRMGAERLNAGSVLRSAAGANREDVFEFILDNDSITEKCIEDNELGQAIIVAASCGSIRVINTCFQRCILHTVTKQEPDNNLISLHKLLRTVLDFDCDIYPKSMIGHDAVANCLLDAGADPQEIFEEDGRAYPPLYFACHWAPGDVLRKMLPSKDINSQYDLIYGWYEELRETDGFTLRFEQIGTFLHIAAFHLNASGADALIEHGSTFNLDHSGRSALHWLSLNRYKAIGYPQGIDDVLQGFTRSVAEDEQRHMEKAASTAKVLIKGGFDVNARDIFGRTPVHYACRYKTISLINILVEHGGNLSQADMYGRTPLHYLAQDEINEKSWNHGTFNKQRYTPELAAFIKRAVSPGEIDFVDCDGKTPLIHAAEGFSPERVSLLINSGARLDMRDASGRTALHYAGTFPPQVKSYCLRTYDTDEAREMRRARWKETHRTMTDILLAAGADRDILNNDGYTARDELGQNVAWLERAMADVKTERNLQLARDEALRNERGLAVGWEFDVVMDWD